MTTLKSLKEELEPYRNTLVIGAWDDIVRLVDVVDEEHDFCWVYDSRTRGITGESCVGGWIPLKGFIPDEEYDRLVRVWNLNNVEKAV